MKKSLFLFLAAFMVLCINTFAADDLETILTQDDTALEKQILTKTQKAGNQYDGVIEKVVGQVLLKGAKEEVWKQAGPNMAIKEGTTIVTMDKAQAKVKLPNGTIVDIRPKTQAYFETLRQDPQKSELTETGIKLLAGKVFSNVKKLVESGSKYEVKTGSATAGVRGTQFEVGVNDDGSTDLTVFEGTVDFSTPSSTQPTPVTKGEKAKAGSDGVIGERTKHNEAPPADVEEEKVIEKAPKEKEAKEDKPAPKEGTGGSGGGSGVKMEAGSEVVDDMSYATIQIKPDFVNIFGSPLGLGLKITLLQGQNQDTGDKVLRYGPSASEKWYDSISLRWVEWETKPFGVRYGELENLTYGQGLLMEGYKTFGVRARVSTNDWAVKGLVPLKESPKTDPDQVYAGRVELRIWKSIFGGVTYVTDLDKTIDDQVMGKSAVAGDVFLPLSSMFTPYVEYAKMINYGQGIGAGFKGQLAFLNYKVEYRDIGDNFKPTLYDEFYETSKNARVKVVSGTAITYLEGKDVVKTSTGAIDTSAGAIVVRDGINLKNTKKYSGYLAQLGLNVMNMVTLKAVYEDYGNEEGKRLTGDAQVKITERINGGITYKQTNIDFDHFGWTQKDTTSIKGRIQYPVNGSVDVVAEYTKKPGESAYQTFRTIISF